MAYLFVFGSLVAFTAYSWLLQHASVSLVSTYAYVNPVVAVFLGALVLAEPITPSIVIGAAIIIAAVAFIVTREGANGAARRTDEPRAAAAARRISVAAMHQDKFVEELWGYAHELEMREHPWFKGIVEHRWTREQIVLGEIQHYLRVRTNPIFFGYIVTNVASERNYALMDIVMENFMEELGGEKTHVDIMLQMLDEAGMDKTAADRAERAPGTMAAIEMIVGGCQRRSALEGIALLSFVEAMHGGRRARRRACTRRSPAITASRSAPPRRYELHAEQDTGHGDRQIEAIRRFARDEETQRKVRAAVKLGLNAFNFEWDGHVQAMTGKREYWSGRAPIKLDVPTFKLPYPPPVGVGGAGLRCRPGRCRANDPGRIGGGCSPTFFGGASRERPRTSLRG